MGLPSGSGLPHRPLSLQGILSSADSEDYILFGFKDSWDWEEKLLQKKLKTAFKKKLPFGAAIFGDKHFHDKALLECSVFKR